MSDVIRIFGREYEYEFECTPRKARCLLHVQRKTNTIKRLRYDTRFQSKVTSKDADTIASSG